MQWLNIITLWLILIYATTKSYSRIINDTDKIVNNEIYDVQMQTEDFENSNESFTETSDGRRLIFPTTKMYIKQIYKDVKHLTSGKCSKNATGINGKDLKNLQDFFQDYLNNHSSSKHDVALLNKNTYSILLGVGGITRQMQRLDKMLQALIFNVTTNITGLYENVRDNYDEYQELSTNLSDVSQRINDAHQMWPSMKSYFNVSNVKLDVISSGQERLKNIMLQQGHQILSELGKASQKVDMTTYEINTEASKMHNELVNFVLTISNQVMDLRRMIEMQIIGIPGSSNDKFQNPDNPSNYPPVDHQPINHYPNVPQHPNIPGNNQFPPLPHGSAIPSGYYSYRDVKNSNRKPNSAIGGLGGFILFPNIDFSGFNIPSHSGPPIPDMSKRPNQFVDSIPHNPYPQFPTKLPKGPMPGIPGIPGSPGSGLPVPPHGHYPPINGHPPQSTTTSYPTTSHRPFPETTQSPYPPAHPPGEARPILIPPGVRLGNGPYHGYCVCICPCECHCPSVPNNWIPQHSTTITTLRPSFQPPILPPSYQQPSFSPSPPSYHPPSYHPPSYHPPSYQPPPYQQPSYHPSPPSFGGEHYESPSNQPGQYQDPSNQQGHYQNSLYHSAAYNKPLGSYHPYLPSSYAPSHNQWDNNGQNQWGKQPSSCNCLCPCPCPDGLNDNVFPTTPTYYEDAGNNPWAFAQPSGAPPSGNGAKSPDIGFPPPDLTPPTQNKSKWGVLRVLRDDIDTMKDEMSVTREAIIGQMSSKIDEMKYFLSDMHHANIAHHNDNKNISEAIKSTIKRSFEDTFYMLNTISGYAMSTSNDLEQLTAHIKYQQQVPQNNAQLYHGYQSKNPLIEKETRMNETKLELRGNIKTESQISPTTDDNSSYPVNISDIDSSSGEEDKITRITSQKNPLKKFIGDILRMRLPNRRRAKLNLKRLPHPPRQQHQQHQHSLSTQEDMVDQLNVTRSSDLPSPMNNLPNLSSQLNNLLVPPSQENLPSHSNQQNLPSHPNQQNLPNLSSQLNLPAQTYLPNPHPSNQPYPTVFPNHQYNNNEPHRKGHKGHKYRNRNDDDTENNSNVFLLSSILASLMATPAQPIISSINPIIPYIGSILGSIGASVLSQLAAAIMSQFVSGTISQFGSVTTPQLGSPSMGNFGPPPMEHGGRPSMGNYRSPQMGNFGSQVMRYPVSSAMGQFPPSAVGPMRQIAASAAGPMGHLAVSGMKQYGSLPIRKASTLKMKPDELSESSTKKNVGEPMIPLSILEKLPKLPKAILMAIQSGNPFSAAYNDGEGSNWNINMNRRASFDSEKMKDNNSNADDKDEDSDEDEDSDSDDDDDDDDDDDGDDDNNDDDDSDSDDNDDDDSDSSDDENDSSESVDSSKKSADD